MKYRLTSHMNLYTINSYEIVIVRKFRLIRKSNKMNHY